MIRIETMEGVKYNLKNIGIIPLNFLISSLSPRHVTEQLEGMDGHVDIETTYDRRILSGRFLLQAKDYNDYALAQNEVFRVFQSKKPFYLISGQEPKKRWKVKVSSGFTPERLSVSDGLFEVEFISAIPFSESIGTTLDPLTFDAEKWQTGQGLTTENPVYVHQASTFRIFNAGDVPVDPRQMPLKIELKGASTNPKITNRTTGDTWQYNGSSGANDTITLSGIRSLKNGTSIFGSTNKKLITIAPGWNDFEITGASNFLITFDFRFYYY